jgi:hypothetical protein
MLCVTDICPCFENKARVFKLHSLVLRGKKEKIVKYNIGLSFQSQRFLLFLVVWEKTFCG